MIFMACSCPSLVLGRLKMKLEDLMWLISVYTSNDVVLLGTETLENPTVSYFKKA